MMFYHFIFKAARHKLKIKNDFLNSNTLIMVLNVIEDFFIPDIASIVLSYYSNGKAGTCNDITSLPDYKLFDFAKEPSNGNTRILNILVKSEKCYDLWLIASSSGNLDMLKWLHDNHQEGCSTMDMDYAAGVGQLEIVKWLHDNRHEGCTTNAMDYAAADGQLEMVKWLHDNRHEGCTTNAMDWAAAEGHLEVVKWLYHNRHEGCTTDAVDWAERLGHLEVVKWLEENVEIFQIKD